MNDETENELAAFEDAGLPANADFGKAIQAAAAEAPLRSSDPFMTFKKGKWTFWDDGEHVPVEKGSQWVCHSGTIQRGWICWGPMGSGKLLGEQMVKLGVDAINEGDLPVKEYEGKTMPWSPNRAILMKCISGEDTGAQVLFKTNTIGGVNEFNDLTIKIADRYAQDRVAYHPIVTLGSTTYESKEYGEQFKPSIKVLGWTALGEELPEPIEVKSAKTKATRKKAAPAAAAAASTAATGSTRRQRRA